MTPPLTAAECVDMSVAALTTASREELGSFSETYYLARANVYAQIATALAITEAQRPPVKMTGQEIAEALLRLERQTGRRLWER